MTKRTYNGKPKPEGKSGHFYEPERHKLQGMGINTGHLADRPEPGKIYALTDYAGKPSIAAGNTWKESEVKVPELKPKASEQKPFAERDVPIEDAMFHHINPFNKAQIGTQGVAELEERGYGWFISDMAIVIGTIPKLRSEEFLVVKLKVNPDHTALATIDDGGKGVKPKILYRQEYKYTDAKDKELKLYFENNTMMLPEER
jgi:hypothetical protein